MIVLSQFAQHQKNGQILALVQMTSVKYETTKERVNISELTAISFATISNFLKIVV